jgi:hypothetical protein
VRAPCVHLSARTSPRCLPRRRSYTYALAATLTAGGDAAATLSLPLRLWPSPPGTLPLPLVLSPLPPLPPSAGRLPARAASFDAAAAAASSAAASLFCEVLSWEDGDPAGVAFGGASSGAGGGAHGAGGGACPESPRIGASDSVSPLFGTPAASSSASQLPSHSLSDVQPPTPQSPGVHARDTPGVTPRRAASFASSPLAMSDGGASGFGRESAGAPGSAGGGGGGGGGGGAPGGIAHPPPTPSGPPPPRAAHYAVRCGDTPLVRVQLRRPGPSCAAGGTLAGTLDFWASHGEGGDRAGGGAPAEEASGAPKAAPLRCVAVAISLDTEERVASSRAVAPRRAAAAPQPLPAAAAAAPVPAGHTLRRVRDEAAEVTADVLCTSFAFSVPADAPPSFTAGPITHAWSLTFEFSLAPATPGAPPQMLRWSLPVTIGAPAHRSARDAAAAAAAMP